MITFLEGTLDTKQLGRVVMNVSGIGYEVLIPLSSYDGLPLEGENCRILTHHHITDADQRLFGFCTEDEREMFLKLLTISGVGPKLAISALSGLPVRELKNALINGDIKRISSISGIGKKTAERLVVEMQDKLKDFAEPPAASMPGLKVVASQEASKADQIQEAESALSALGYKPQEASRAVAAVVDEEFSSSEELIRAALKGMAVS